MDDGCGVIIGGIVVLGILFYGLLGIGALIVSFSEIFFPFYYTISESAILWIIVPSLLFAVIVAIFWLFRDGTIKFDD